MAGEDEGGGSGGAGGSADAGGPADAGTTVHDLDSDGIEAASAAIRDGGLVVYPTETVYGLGADALDAAAVQRVFVAKERSQSKPVSMALPSVDATLKYVEASAREERFMREFLPGPLTVIVERGDRVPDVLTAGRDSVGVRVPDHGGARTLLEAVAPVTATSANVSGEPSARRVADLDDRIREHVTVVLDGGETPGGGSTVVDVASGEMHRPGPLSGVIEEWLDTGGG